MPRGEQRGDGGHDQHGGEHAPKDRNSGMMSRPSGITLQQAGPPSQDGLVVEEPLQVGYQVVRRRIAIARRSLAGLVDDGLQVPRYIGGELAQPGGLGIANLLDQTATVLLVKGGTEGEHLVKGESE